MLDQLPAINASLNAISTVLLLNGLRHIKAKRIEQHRRMMLSAFAVSIAFLACYLLHKWHLYGTTGSYNTTFQGQGTWRLVYLVLLSTHVILAASVPVLAFITLFRGIKMQVERHRAIARVTFPIWLYVSVTGVLVYFMLYRWFA
ncbi:MAG: DUF420 domain-containing protein [Candidatus Kapabacteria bacterium]|nr:DUF420 domain-containing protein [Candidatus Kapabacteria bacterium]